MTEATQEYNEILGASAPHLAGADKGGTPAPSPDHPDTPAAHQVRNGSKFLLIGLAAVLILVLLRWGKGRMGL